MITAEELSRLPLFAKLGPLDRSAPDIHAAPSEYLVHEGDGRALWITAHGLCSLCSLVANRMAAVIWQGPATRRRL
jgi:thioredoxin reductase (NADPH)